MNEQQSQQQQQSAEWARNRLKAMDDVDEYIHDVDFPCGKQYLLEFARSNDAPQEIMDELAQVPDKEYGSTVDLARAMGAVKSK